MNLYKEWNPSEPIESFLLNIETQQVFATKAGRPFHTYLLIEAALSAIKNTRQFKDELKEWNKDHPNSILVQWHQQFKSFRIKKYEEYERDRSTMMDGGYHGASNTEDDASSIASLNEAFASLQTERSQQNLALQALVQQVQALSQLVSQQQASNAQQSVQSIPSNIQFPPAPPAYQQYAAPSVAPPACQWLLSSLRIRVSPTPYSNLLQGVQLPQQLQLIKHFQHNTIAR